MIYCPSFALRYSALRYSALRYSALRYSALRYSALRYSALRYSALLCAALRYSALRYVASALLICIVASADEALADRGELHLGVEATAGEGRLFAPRLSVEIGSADWLGLRGHIAPRFVLEDTSASLAGARVGVSALAAFDMLRLVPALEVGPFYDSSTRRGGILARLHFRYFFGLQDYAFFALGPEQGIWLGSAGYAWNL